VPVILPVVCPMRKPIVKNIRTRQDVNFIKKSLFSVPNINRRGEKEHLTPTICVASVSFNLPLGSFYLIL